MPDVKGLPLENLGYVPASHQRDKTVLWRRGVALGVNWALYWRPRAT